MEENPVEQTVESQAPPIPVAARDVFLQHLVSLTNLATRGSLPITLSVNGMLVSGTLASTHEYFAETSKTIANSIFSGKETEASVKFQKEIADLAPNPAVTPDETAFTDLNYVHIRDAKFFTAGGQTMNVSSSVLWRGRLCEVAGWSFGKFDLAA